MQEALTIVDEHLGRHVEDVHVVVQPYHPLCQLRELAVAPASLREAARALAILLGGLYPPIGGGGRLS